GRVRSRLQVDDDGQCGGLAGGTDGDCGLAGGDGPHPAEGIDNGDLLIAAGEGCGTGQVEREPVGGSAADADRVRVPGVDEGNRCWLQAQLAGEDGLRGRAGRRREEQRERRTANGREERSAQILHGEYLAGRGRSGRKSARSVSRQVEGKWIIAASVLE